MFTAHGRAQIDRTKLLEIIKIELNRNKDATKLPDNIFDELNETELDLEKVMPKSVAKDVIKVFQEFALVKSTKDAFGAIVIMNI